MYFGKNDKYFLQSGINMPVCFLFFRKKDGTTFIPGPAAIGENLQLSIKLAVKAYFGAGFSF